MKRLTRIRSLGAVFIFALLCYACSSSSQITATPSALAPATAPLPTETPTSHPTLTLPPPTPSPLPPTLTLEASSTPQPSQTPDISGTLEGVDLVAALRQGGYVIYFRHAETDQSQTDSPTLNFQDCSTQRNLNEQGRADARAIGEAFVMLDIPIDRVLSSKYCRTRETALLAFGMQEDDLDLTGFPSDQQEQRTTALRQLLSKAPPPGMNTVLVAHGFNITAATGLTIVEGEAVIFAPAGAGGFNLVARVLPAQWAEFAQMATPQGNDGLIDFASLILPDLRPLAPSDLFILVNAETGEKQLRFTSSIQNDGPGDIEVWGYSDPTSLKTIVVQHIDTLQNVQKNVVVGEFIFHPEHDHWHLGNFARYEVWTVSPEGALDARISVRDKVSYCLRDDTQGGAGTADYPQAYTGCNRQKQGITPGWIDIYKYDLPGQSLDVSGLPDGIYALQNIVDPDGLLWDGNRDNNTTAVLIEIAGERVSIVE